MTWPPYWPGRAKELFPVTEALGYARGPLALRHAQRAVDAALDLPVEARGFFDDGPRKAAFLGR
jgi:hypothetical protein